MSDEGGAGVKTGSMMAFRSRRRLPPMARDEARRQGEITRLAFLALGREAAIEFLNSPDPAFDGTPLKLATASAHGQSVVEAALSRLAAR